MQIGFTADTFHFLLIVSYKLQRQGGYRRAGQGRQLYMEANQHSKSGRELKLEPLLRPAEWLGGEKKGAQPDFGANSTRWQNSGILSELQK